MRTDWGFDVPQVRQAYSEHFPEIVDRTKDFAAALIADHARYYAADKKSKEYQPYESGVARRLQKYAPEWREDIERKITEERWIWLPERRRELAFEDVTQ